MVAMTEAYFRTEFDLVERCVIKVECEEIAAAEAILKAEEAEEKKSPPKRAGTDTLWNDRKRRLPRLPRLPCCRDRVRPDRARVV